MLLHHKSFKQLNEFVMTVHASFRKFTKWHLMHKYIQQHTYGASGAVAPSGNTSTWCDIDLNMKMGNIDFPIPA